VKQTLSRAKEETNDTAGRLMLKAQTQNARFSCGQKVEPDMNKEIMELMESYKMARIRQLEARQAQDEIEYQIVIGLAKNADYELLKVNWPRLKQELARQ
jgi:hypothetical protein